ncbi:MAG: DUF4388 domain-containing protein [Ktedonobacteraceae bacterium]
MELQDRIMDGDLQTLGLQSILKMLALSAKTGTLLVHSGPETLVISLRKGQIIALHEEGVPQPDLLGMLCLINKLDPPRAHALRDASQGNLSVALALMTEQGWMMPQEMQQRLEFAVTQAISHALRWVEGRFAFHRQMVTMESRMQPLDVDSMLLEALRQADEWEEIGDMSLTRTTVSRWLPEVSKDVRSLGLNQEHIDVLCLSNGEIPLQGMSLALLVPEARVAKMMARLLELHLIEVVDTSLEAELQQDLSNIIIMCQHTLAQQRQNNTPVQHLLGLIHTLGQGINGLLIHHGTYAKSLRGRGQLPIVEIVRYLERRFAQPLQTLARQQYAILETAIFVNGQLDYSEIVGLDKLVKGEQLEEFYWGAVQGLGAFLRTVFTSLLQDEVGNSHTGRQLNVVWKAFLTEIDQEMHQYQLYRAHQNTQHPPPNRNRRTDTLNTPFTQNEGNPHWSPESQWR